MSKVIYSLFFLLIMGGCSSKLQKNPYGFSEAFIWSGYNSNNTYVFIEMGETIKSKVDDISFIKEVITFGRENYSNVPFKNKTICFYSGNCPLHAPVPEYQEGTLIDIQAFVKGTKPVYSLFITGQNEHNFRLGFPID